MMEPVRRQLDPGEPAEPEGYTIDLPRVAVIERLAVWYSDQAASDANLAVALDAQGLDIAAEANRKRVRAYRLTVTCLRALLERCCRPETEFRGHLKARARPKAQVRAPP